MREAKADEKEVMKMQKDMAKIAAGKKKPKKKVRENTRPLARVLSRSVRVPHGVLACLLCSRSTSRTTPAAGWATAAHPRRTGPGTSPSRYSSLRIILSWAPATFP